MHSLFLLLLFTCTPLWLSRSPFAVLGSDLPPVTCPKYFQYLSEGDGFIGKITLFNLPKDAIHVDLLLSQHQFVTDSYVGNLTLYEDVYTTENNLKEKKPIKYRVSFPFSNELPKVTKISVNGIRICSSTNYPMPSEKIALTHSFFPSDIPESERTKRPFPAGFNVKYKFGAHDDAKTDQTTAATTTTTTKSSRLVARPPSPVPTKPAVATSSNTECGFEGVSSMARIVGGTELRRGEYPWLVAIYRKHYTGLQFICGGSLVSSRTVLTAAHCFKLHSLKAQHIVVFLGRHNLENYSEDGVVAREVEKLLIHSDYNTNAFADADLALLQMDSPVGFDEYIHPICLWSDADDAQQGDEKMAIVAGWGADENGYGISPLPKKVGTNIVSNDDCAQSMKDFKAQISPRTICAGKRDVTGPCIGDSGGGLMVNRDGRWFIRGIVSAGQTTEQTCNLREYVIYCDLAKHMAWVKSNVWN